MSEKRFTFDREVEFEIYDNVTKKSYDGTIGCQEKICQLLNELNEENEQLRKKLECCEYEHFKKEQDKIYQKVKKGDLSDFGTLTISDSGTEHWNGVLK